jgi:hypothetical protein
MFMYVVHKKNQVCLVQFIEKKFMEIDYNMLVQNHVHYNYVVKKSLYGVVVQWLKIWLLNMEVRSSNPTFATQATLAT